MPHSTVWLRPIGLMARPQSCAHTRRLTHTPPVCAIHFDLGDHRDDRVAAVRVGDAAARGDVARGARLRRRPRVPAVLLGGRFHDGQRARLAEHVVLGARLEHLEPELHGIGFRRRRELVDEAFERERHLRAVRVAQVAGAQRRLPDHRQRDDVRRHALIRDRVLHRRRLGARPRRCARAACP